MMWISTSSSRFANSCANYTKTMKKTSKTQMVSEQSKILATKFVDSIMNKDKKGAEAALKEMVNNHISAKIKKVAQTEDLI